MKKETLLVVISLVFLVGGYFIGSFFPVNSVVKSSSLNTELDSFAYGVGIDMGNSIVEFTQQFDLEKDFPKEKYLEGLNSGLDQDESTMTRMVAQMSVQQYLMKRQGEMQAKAEVEAQEILEEGVAFLEENKIKAGVFTTESGLQYEILEEGNGPKPKEDDTVVVNYEGTLIDGTVFDSSYESGEPATFAVNAVIAGWTEGLQLMPVGSKWKFYIPSDLAYGDRQRSELIKANSTLIFTVELLEIKGE